MTERSTRLVNAIAANGMAALADPSRIAGFSALLLGAFFILGVGFAGAEVIHNAAHDGRHSMVFPCH
jgi:cobalt transporter subunit CbtB